MEIRLSEWKLRRVVLHDTRVPQLLTIGSGNSAGLSQNMNEAIEFAT